MPLPVRRGTSFTCCVPAGRPTATRMRPCLKRRFARLWPRCCQPRIDDERLREALRDLRTRVFQPRQRIHSGSGQRWSRSTAPRELDTKRFKP